MKIKRTGNPGVAMNRIAERMAKRKEEAEDLVLRAADAIMEHDSQIARLERNVDKLIQWAILKHEPQGLELSDEPPF
jgi:hypothetical protein